MSKTNPFVHVYSVDLQRGSVAERERHPLAQGDAYADKIIVHVQDGGKPVRLEGVGVMAKVIRADGQTVPLVGTVEGGAACVTLDAACYAVPGEVRVSVALAAGDTVQTVLLLTLNVETSETGIIVDNGVFGDLSAALGMLAEMRPVVATSAPAIVMDTSGAVVGMTDAAERDALGLVTTISPTTAGVSAVTLTHTGRNLLRYVPDDVVTMTYIRANGNEASVKGYNITLPPGRYRVRGDYKAGITDTLYVYGVIVDAGGTATGKSAVNVVVGQSTYTIDITIDDGERLLLYNGQTSQSVNATKTAFGKVTLGIYLAGSDTSYTPYEGQTLTAALPVTVYGGTLDWLAGELVITHDADGAELTEPIVHQLAPQQLTLFKGSNSVWSDAGGTAVSYIVDTKMYIDSVLAAIAASIINA